MWKGLIYLIKLIQREASGRGVGCSVDSDFMISGVDSEDSGVDSEDDSGVDSGSDLL